MRRRWWWSAPAAPAAPAAAAAAAALALALALAGCGGGSPTPTVASLGPHGARSASGVALTEAQSDGDMVAFTRCMRAHGVQMSDPYHRPGHAGLSIDTPPHDGATAGAYAACNHILEPLIQMKMAHATAVAAHELPALTHYAECMRSHDIDMLDPTSYGALNLGNVPGINYAYGRYSPQFRAADSACRHLLPAGVRDDGSGP